MKNTCTLLNITGDVTIGWDSENSKEIKKWIQEKLDDGCTFFLIERKMIFLKKEIEVHDVDSLPEKGFVKVSDSDSDKFLKIKKNDVSFGDSKTNELVKNNYASHVKKENNNKHNVKKVSKDVSEIASNHTICSRRMMGG